MTDVMKGVRILEVAEHMFVPAASAILSDWGADVIKVEHHLRGDAMRGLGSTGVLDLSKGVHVLNEHSNRGKRSIGLDLSSEEGVQVLYELAKTCDVVLGHSARPNDGYFSAHISMYKCFALLVLLVESGVEGDRA